MSGQEEIYVYLWVVTIITWVNEKVVGCAYRSAATYLQSTVSRTICKRWIKCYMVRKNCCQCAESTCRGQDVDLCPTPHTSPGVWRDESKVKESSLDSWRWEHIPLSLAEHCCLWEPLKQRKKQQKNIHTEQFELSFSSQKKYTTQRKSS